MGGNKGYHSGRAERGNRGSAEWVIEKAAWRRWYLSLSLEDGKALMFCPLNLLSLPGNVPMIWLDSVRPFGWMHSGREGKEGCSGQ